ncbi:Fe-S cluster protector protein [secondary endosymbiont of Heteropsylla cubana]|uniref:Probable Fe(2+)-trafficking protein n=1 Tax=secondary endosymbiont of Heteropsylla cubana TaxID=134287 RepID=J3Z636_9ENTR|nr:oxidative damage protection protein [secondary endosymbiont of Heteropsylla cubana]AFP85839.1 Fe-S cluster protector protein [secondary endosymbiont of Heteropsylla cubana]
MSRVIYCMFLKRQAEGQHFQVYPGKIGKLIYDHISNDAWEQWKIKQTMIINQKKLSMINILDRKTLEQEMIKFLFQDKKLYTYEDEPHET